MEHTPPAEFFALMVLAFIGVLMATVEDWRGFAAIVLFVGGMAIVFGILTMFFRYMGAA